ncbi:DUF4090 family protein [Kovacikia minuta]
MSSETTSQSQSSESQSTTGADAIDGAIARGVDFDGSPIPPAKLELYNKVMGLEAGRQRSGGIQYHAIAHRPNWGKTHSPGRTQSTPDWRRFCPFKRKRNCLLLRQQVANGLLVIGHRCWALGN